MINGGYESSMNMTYIQSRRFASRERNKVPIVFDCIVFKWLSHWFGFNINRVGLNSLYLISCCMIHVQLQFNKIASQS